MYSPLDRRAVNKYFTTEAQEKTQQIFEQVHYPMDRIRVELCREAPTHGKFADEGTIAEWILGSEPTAWRNRVFSVIGETGSGKSEFCRFLQYAAAGQPGHVPILISRSTVQLASITRLLNEHAGLTETESVSEITDIPEDLLVQRAVVEAETEVYRRFRSRYTEPQMEELRRKLEDRAFRALVKRSYHQYNQELRMHGRERELNLLNRREFDLLFINALPWLDRDDAYEACREAIQDDLKRMLRLSSVHDRLVAIAHRYRELGKRPLLILEDLTSFGFLKEELLDYLFDLNSGNFDVVIGWTTGFESENLGTIFRKQGDAYTYMLERLRGRFVMTDEQRTSWFLEQHHVDMMLRYIHAARQESGIDLPAAEPFPLNAPFISRVYQRLLDYGGQPKRTPRLLLDAIQVILASPDKPWRTAGELVDRNLLAGSPLSPELFELEGNYPDAVHFLHWYGDPDTGLVSRQEAERLAVELPPPLSRYLADSSRAVTEAQPAPDPQLGNSIDTADDTQGEPAPEPSPLQEEPKPESMQPAPPQLPGPQPPQPQPPQPPRQPAEELEVQQWLSQSGSFPARRGAEKAIGDLLEVYGDPYGLGNPQGNLQRVLRYQKGKVHVVFAGTQDTVPDFPALTVRKERRLYTHLVAALKVKGKSDAERTLDENPATVQWVGRLYDEYRQAQMAQLDERLGMPVDLFVYHLYLSLVGLSRGDVEGGLAALAGFDPTLPVSLPELKCLTDTANVRSLLDLRRTITNLFRSFFYLNPTTLDAARLQRVHAGYSYHQVGGLLVSGTRKEIDQGFWVQVEATEVRAAGTDKLPLARLVLLARSLYGRLREAARNLAPDRERLQEAELREFAAGLDASILSGLLPRLEHLMVTFHMAKGSEWPMPDQLAQMDIPGALIRLEAVAASAAASTDVFGLITAHRAYEEVLRLPVTAVLRYLSRLVRELEDESIQMEGTFKDRVFREGGNQASNQCEAEYSALVAAVEGGKH